MAQTKEREQHKKGKNEKMNPGQSSQPRDPQTQPGTDWKQRERNPQVMPGHMEREPEREAD